MPQVPTYGPRKVDTRPLPGVERGPAPSPESFGAGFGQTLTRVGLHGLDAELQARQVQRTKQDQIAVLEASNQLSAWRANRLYHPETGLLQTRKGKDAFGLPEEVTAEYEQVSNQIAGTLSTDEQREAFARVQATTRDAVRMATYEHVDRQMTQFADAQAKAGVALAASEAIQFAGQPLLVNRALTTGAAIIKDHLQGQSPEAVNEALQSFTTGVHTGIIDKLLTANQDRAAQVYYDETKTQISGEAQARIEKALEVGSLRGESQRAADAIRQAGGTPAEQIEQARQITDPELRDETETRVRQDLARDRAAADQAHEDVMVNAASLIEKTHRYDAIPPSDIATMTVGERAGLRAYAKSLQPGESAIETDLVAYYNLQRLASDDPESFKKLNLTTYLHKLGKTEFKEIVNLQSDMRAAKPKAEAALDGFRTNQQILDDTLQLAGIDTSNTKEARESGAVAEVAKIRKTLDDKVQALQRLTGKPATNADVQQLADDLLKTIVLEQGGWANILPGGAPFYPVTTRVVHLTVADIPKRDREQVEQALRDAGRPVTPEAVVNLYLATKRKQGEVK